MIRLNLPSETDRNYGIIGGFIVGPLSSNGEPLRQFGTLEYRFPGDSISRHQSSLRGDKPVYHTKTSADISYQPILVDIVSDPTPSRPKAVVWTCHPASSPSSSTRLRADWGVLGSWNACSYSDQSSFYNVAVERTSDGFNVVYVGALRSQPKLITYLYEERYSNIRSLKGKINFGRKAFSYPTGIGINAGGSWNVPRSADDIISSRNGRSYSVTVNDASSTDMFTYTGVYSTSPRSAMDMLNAFVTTRLNPFRYPVDDEDFGDLAMKASEKVNANRVNMIAFIRDLRHPTEMIPKLRNLKNLKGFADNYLTVKYGILPTIDDVESIMAAFKKHKPYFDKNGFSTYNASHSGSASLDGVDFRLEQHIKLAIADEDSQVLDLMSRAESIGVLPTFQNIWDLIPYSFVVDWLVDIGGLLERVDANLRLLRLNVQYVTMSRKTVTSSSVSPSSSIPYIGSIEQVRYHRWVTDHCPEPPLSLQHQTEFNHWLESAALLIQRRK